MIATRRSGKVLLAVACCLVIILLPLSASAQLGHVVKKGAEGVQKGVETGAEKTKEGAETVGREVKKTITGDDSDTNTSTTTAPSSTGSTSTSAERTRSTHGARTGETGKSLPATAGELPLLALVGSLAFAGSAALRLLWRKR